MFGPHSGVIPSGRAVVVAASGTVRDAGHDPQKVFGPAYMFAVSASFRASFRVQETGFVLTYIYISTLGESTLVWFNALCQARVRLAPISLRRRGAYYYSLAPGRTGVDYRPVEPPPGTESAQLRPDEIRRMS